MIRRSWGWGGREGKSRLDHVVGRGSIARAAFDHIRVPEDCVKVGLPAAEKRFMASRDLTATGPTGAETTRDRMHRHAQRTKLPVEAITDMVTLLEVDSALASIKTAESQEALTEAADHYERQKLLQTQLIKSMRTCAKDRVTAGARHTTPPPYRPGNMPDPLSLFGIRPLRPSPTYCSIEYSCLRTSSVVPHTLFCVLFQGIFFFGVYLGGEGPAHPTRTWMR